MKNKFNFTSSQDALMGLVDRVEDQYQKDDEVTISGISTGFADIDLMTSGLCNGTLNVIAGRPSTGKSTLMRNIAEHVSLTSNNFVFYLDFSTPIQVLQESQMVSLGRIASSQIKGAALDDLAWKRLISVCGLVNEKQKLTYGDNKRSNLNEVVGQIEYALEQHPLSLVCIDSIQLIGSVNHRDNRYAQVAEISGVLKKLSIKHNIPFLVTSAVNRNLEQRADKRPLLSDLRDSGTIEDDADVVMFTYRDELYCDDSLEAGTAEVILGKQRTGPIGKVRLIFNGQFSRFDTYVQPKQDNDQ